MEISGNLSENYRFLIAKTQGTKSGDPMKHNSFVND